MALRRTETKQVERGKRAHTTYRTPQVEPPIMQHSVRQRRRSPETTQWRRCSGTWQRCW